MACTSCVNQCLCALVAGDGTVTVSGSGSGADPYRIVVNPFGVSALYVPIIGGTMTGKLTTNVAAGAGVRFQGNSNNPYAEWFQSDGVTRIGFLQGATSGGSQMILAADSGPVKIFAFGAQIASFTPTISVINGDLQPGTVNVGIAAIDTRLRIVPDTNVMNVEATNTANSVKKAISFQKYGGYVGIGLGDNTSGNDVLKVFGKVGIDTLVSGANTTDGLWVAKGMTLIGASRGWPNMHIRAQSTNNASNTNSAGISLLVSGSSGAYAAMIDIYELSGTKVRHLVGDNSAHCPVEASAFNVISAIETKDLVGDGSTDIDFLSAIEASAPKTYFWKEPPKTFRPTEEFKAKNALRVASGKEALVPDIESLKAYPHDCTIDGCTGTADSPCAIIRNAGVRVGLIAHEVAAVLPHAVTYDVDGRPEAVQLDQLVAALWGALGQMTAKITELEASIQKK